MIQTRHQGKLTSNAVTLRCNDWDYILPQSLIPEENNTQRITGMSWASFGKKRLFEYHREGCIFLYLVLLSISCLETTWNTTSYLDNCLRAFQAFSFRIIGLLNISIRMTNTKSKILATFEDNEAKAILVILDVTFMTHCNKYKSWAEKASEIKALRTSGE